MKKLIAVAVFCACLSSAFAQPPGRGRGMKAEAGAISETVQKLEHDWTDAQRAGDVDKLSEIIADDWRGLQYDGTVMTKKQLLSETKSGENKLESFEFGPMEVKVLGRVAIVQGSDTEKSSLKGKDTSGHWVWMDVFVDRDGKWVAVRSQSAKVK